MKGTAFLTTVLCLLAMTTGAVSLSLEGKLEEIEKRINKTLAENSYVGVSVGIVEDGEIIFAKGYGLRNHTDPHSYVTNQTIFSIASLTKGFTAYAMDRLVSVDGLVDWNDLVTRHIPEFRMSDAHTTAHVRVKDLLSHTTGMARHDASLLYSTFPREEFLTRLPHLQTIYYLREKFVYTNIMYAIAGIVIERVANRSWEEFVRERIFEPLNMTRSYARIADARNKGVDDIAQPHSTVPGTLNVTGLQWVSLTNAGPAGSIVSSAEDLSKWIQEQLSLSERSQVMHVPIINHPSRLSDQYDFGYGFGWTLSYYCGQSVVWHNGAIDGFSSYILMIPASKRGVVVLANADFAGSITLHLPYQIADILASNGTDRQECKMVLKTPMLPERDIMLPHIQVKEIPAHEPVEDATQYVGFYKNLGYGELKVTHIASKLFVTYNTLLYALAFKNDSNFFVATASHPKTIIYEGSFVRDFLTADLIGVQFHFETDLPPIYFEKKPSEDLYDLAYLREFAGTYGNSRDLLFTVSEGRRLLVVSSPRTGELAFADGQELKPYKRDWFLLEDGHYLFEFERLDEKVSRIHWHVGHDSLSFNKTL